ncbi:hypothetical protein [Bradyrhizobium genosp. P]|uniref:hypothetical protein n=1 Tax=Bradyrhizobium genosp. P TaxID=83641 RepID=UPI003CEF12C3
MGGRVVPQPPDVATRIVIITVTGFLGFVALTLIGLFFFLKAGAPTALRKAVERPFPEPTLQTAPQDDLKQFEREQRAALSRYRWVDRSKDLVQIPIDEAMRIVAARGDHAYDPIESSASTPSAPTPNGAQP